MLIPNQWYGICPSAKIKEGQVVGPKRLGKQIALFRRKGSLGCLVDRCSHRRAALSSGKVRGEHLACPFHGIAFDESGKAVAIPTPGRTSGW